MSEIFNNLLKKKRKREIKKTHTHRPKSTFAIWEATYCTNRCIWNGMHL